MPLQLPDHAPRPVPQGPGFPYWSFVSAVGITLLALGVLARASWRSYQVVVAFGSEQLAIERVCGEITSLDEVLTMSTRMAVATGDRSWQARYDEHVILLEQALERASRLAPGQIEDEAAAQTDEANRILVALELEAFDLVRAGERDAAARLLDGEEYVQNKRIYAQGMERLLGSMRARTDEILEAESGRGRQLVMVLLLCLPLLTFLWLIVGRSIQAHLEQQTLSQAALHEYARAVERGNREVQAALRAKGEFLARMSHEVRTPMNGVLGVAELLAESRLDDSQREYVQIIRNSGSLLLSIIDDVLDVSKIEAGMLRVNPGPTDVHGVAQDVVALLQPRAHQKGIALECRIADDVPSSLQSDPMRLRQILLNVVGNAVKFTAHGEVSLTLKTERTPAGNLYLHCAVRDTGPGIPADRLGSVFESFVQADASVGLHFGGTGLGLTISRELVRLLGGEIEVSSEVGVGTEFRVSLPTEVLAAQTLPERSPSTSGSARWNARVLVVEDNPVNLLVARRTIERTGCEVHSAADGQECLERLADGSYDMIFMDCGLPVLDGFEATRRIRAREASGRRIPIVALTASVFPGDMDACRAAGMDDFLAKPFRLEQVKVMLQRWLAEHRTADATQGERVA